MSLYGQMVSEGIWRDYAITENDGQMVFSVFCAAQEGPSYRIVKDGPVPAGSGAFTVVGSHGETLARSKRLDQAIWLFRKMLVRVVPNA